MTYVYPAILTPVDGGGYAVHFPDLPGTNSQGKDLTEALYMARDALASWLEYLLDENEPLPQPTIPYIAGLASGEIVTLVDADMTAYRRRKNNKAVKKTLTIPAWLNEEAEAQKINFSAVLQAGLKEILQIKN